MKHNTIKTIGRSDFINMGPIRLRQPLPTQNIEMADPFVLLHHYGPYEISEANNPFDLGPHPHRGFEPVTFLFQGEQLHRDSLGNESIVKAGDVQWTTAGRGIIHAEAPTKDFVAKGGIIEGIQLWLNLPAERKMIQPNYQHVVYDDFNVITSDDKKVDTRIVAGEFQNKYGKIQTQTPVNAFMIEAKTGGKQTTTFPIQHQGLLYLINGKVTVNDSEVLELNQNQFVQFNQDGVGFDLEALEESMLLFISGEPLNEPVATYGPYVMNNQTELMEAMRDYQMGKMGFLPANY
ncbi:nuclease PIN [Winogradskyella sp. PC-19]|uniref:pirin family protein n=1 Tax=unclassified Winogradskyella TaxID=2615021 RepID=UPI000B3C0795|nr:MULTISPECIES: pirin family protein [unclassified Winogradskyella]ARV08651.1 nuclease PIN [Winogradskyella sp. PC-19]RZN74809.1 MAG: pirin family protein [Winogradskyella sp.]